MVIYSWIMKCTGMADEKVMHLKKQFIYVLKLIPVLLKEENWTAREEEIVDRHFKKLQGVT